MVPSLPSLPVRWFSVQLLQGAVGLCPVPGACLGAQPLQGCLRWTGGAGAEEERSSF